jgi:hypothetical protein
MSTQKTDTTETSIICGRSRSLIIIGIVIAILFVLVATLILFNYDQLSKVLKKDQNASLEINESQKNSTIHDPTLEDTAAIIAESYDNDFFPGYTKNGGVWSIELLAKVTEIRSDDPFRTKVEYEELLALTVGGDEVQFSISAIDSLFSGNEEKGRNSYAGLFQSMDRYNFYDQIQYDSASGLVYLEIPYVDGDSTYKEKLFTVVEKMPGESLFDVIQRTYSYNEEYIHIEFNYEMAEVVSNVVSNFSIDDFFMFEHCELVRTSELSAGSPIRIPYTPGVEFYRFQPLSIYKDVIDDSGINTTRADLASYGCDVHSIIESDNLVIFNYAFPVDASQPKAFFYDTSLLQ